MPILIAILLFVLVAASTWWFGLWSNLITLVNLFLASLIASSIYHPVANQIMIADRSYSLLADFVAVWVSFVISFMVLRGITDVISGYRLKFHPAVEMTGRTLLSLWIAGVFVCFAMFTLQLAPLPTTFYGKGPQMPSELGTIPDRAWLAFVQSRSRGALSSSKEANPLFGEYSQPPHPDDIDLDARVFDPYAKFLSAAELQRFVLSKQERLRGRAQAD